MEHALDIIKVLEKESIKSIEKEFKFRLYMIFLS